MAISSCDALRHYIFTILQSSTRRISSLESWRMTDRRRRKNHYGTSHQARETSRQRRILLAEEAKPSHVLPHHGKTGDMNRRGGSYVEKKYLAAKKRRGHTWDAPLRSSVFDSAKMEWKTNVRIENRFVLLKHFMKFQVAHGKNGFAEISKNLVKYKI